VPVDPLGNFAWKDMSAGSYVVQIRGGPPGSFYLKSAAVGGRNIESEFTVSGPATVDLVVSTDAATIEGMVMEKDKNLNDEHPVPNATVVAVPEREYRKLPERFGVGSADQQGHFTIHGLAPGSYTVFAWPDVVDGIWRDSDFLESQEANGISVKAVEGSNLKLQLKPSAVSEEWR
jgi:hypothetical protein